MLYMRHIMCYNSSELLFMAEHHLNNVLKRVYRPTFMRYETIQTLIGDLMTISIQRGVIAC